MLALVSTKGSPGATTSALAFTLTWPGGCLLAECDPAGGDILAGYLQGQLPASRGLAPLSVACLRGAAADALDAQLVDLAAPGGQRLALPGVVDPAQSATVASVWPAVADQLAARSADGWQVIADCGRLSTHHFGWSVLERADRVVLVVRGTLPSVSAAVPALRSLRERATGPTEPGLLVVEAGPYRASEVGRMLDVEVLATLPGDPRTAARLTLGGPVHHRARLLRAAAAAYPLLAGGSAPARVEVSGGV